MVDCQPYMSTRSTLITREGFAGEMITDGIGVEVKDLLWLLQYDISVWLER